LKLTLLPGHYQWTFVPEEAKRELATERRKFLLTEEFLREQLL
jgi:hypothetical protein